MKGARRKVPPPPVVQDPHAYRLLWREGVDNPGPGGNARQRRRLKPWNAHYRAVMRRVWRALQGERVIRRRLPSMCEVCRAAEATIKGATAWVCAGCSTWKDFSGPGEDR